MKSSKKTSYQQDTYANIGENELSITQLGVDLTRARILEIVFLIVML